MKIDVQGNELTASDGRPMWAHRVFLDGVERKDAFAADDESGTVSVYVTDPPLTGNEDLPEFVKRIVVEDGTVKTKILHGNVSIVAIEQG